MSKGELAKAHILDEAVQLASVYGLHGLTIGNLAKHTRMSKGGICAHFATKQLLQMAVVEQASHLFTRAVIVPTLSHPAGHPRLVALGQAWFAYLENAVFDGGCFFTNVLLETDDIEDEEVRATVRRYYQQFLSFVRKEAEMAQQHGEFRADVECGQFVFEFIGILLGVLVWRGLGRQQDGITTARTALEALLARLHV